MNRTEQIYIQLISNSIKDEHKPIDWTGFDEKQLVLLSKLHKNVGLVYGALSRQKNAPQNILHLFEKGFYTEMMNYSKKFTTFQMVLKALNESGIKHIIVKGMSYAKCYRQTEFRTMSDMDLIVSPEKIQKAHDILNELGGKLDYEGSNEKVRCYRINNTAVEIHTSIGYAQYFNRHYDYEKYFQKAIQESICTNAYTYEFSPYYKIVYAVFHMAKHLYESGCGVRMLTDFAVLLDYYRAELNMKRLHIDLNKMGLFRFVSGLSAICRKWFQIEIEDWGETFEQLEQVENYILSGDVFGHRNTLKDMSQIKKQKGNNSVLKAWKWAFPSYRHMKEHSNWFKDKPAILLPAAYAERFLRNAKERGGMVHWIKNLKQGRQEKEVQNIIISIMGLTNEQ